VPQEPPRILQSADFRRWLGGLRDGRARDRVLVRLRRLSLGNPGDVRSLGEGLFELRIDYGPGYRVYFARRGAAVILLVYGGDKSRQKSDIARARELAAAWEADDGD
jgi:putative addiction module killer protein